MERPCLVRAALPSRNPHRSFQTLSSRVSMETSLHRLAFSHVRWGVPTRPVSSGSSWLLRSILFSRNGAGILWIEEGRATYYQAVM